VSEETSFVEETDVIVVGYGFSGGIAAIEAADAGARVILLEKMPDPGGISVCSAGSARSARDFDDAFAYLKTTNGGRTPDDVIEALARGMVGIEKYLERLAGACGLTVSATTSRDRKTGANYPLPGWDTFYHTLVDDIPGFDPKVAYPYVAGLAGGRRLFHVLERNIALRPRISVRLESPVKRLIARGVPGAAEAVGVELDGAHAGHTIKAKRGIVLACGGFECDEETKRQYWQMTPVLPAMGRQNTGDGIRMAQTMGAKLWHMWHYHGAYGFRHPEADTGGFPYGIRMKRLPDWVPGVDARTRAQMSWILVDADGKRFMNEMPPYTQDTGARAFEFYDTQRQRFPRVPAHMIVDEDGRRMYRLADPCFNERGIDFKWSEDNLAEVEAGILKRADSLGELAQIIGADEKVLAETIERWNVACDADRDRDFARPAGSFTPIRKPPYYTAEVWPVLSNTQGGPVHDACQRIIDAEGKPIPRLYAAGEMGSAFGHLYMSGGNISECFVTGRIAGTEAAKLTPLA
jgi:succinate dehydrogenase/fumarate reductase flavoprotein subunit